MRARALSCPIWPVALSELLVTVRSRRERSRLCLGPPKSVEVVEQRAAQRGLVKSQHGMRLATLRGSEPTLVPFREFPKGAFWSCSLRLAPEARR